MVKFKPIIRNPGDLIASDDWNKMQGDIKDDIEELDKKIEELKGYVKNMLYSVTLAELKSPIGSSYNLDENIPGENENYGATVVGNITKQWCIGKKKEVVCKFGIVDAVDILYYWAGANNGDKKTLKITIEYADGDVYSTDELFIHEFSELRIKGKDNPYVEYLLSPNENVWYKYMLKNPKPEKEVRYISFENTSQNCSPRIGNVIQYLTRIKNLSSLIK
ncbi:MAG: hypothetical protein CVT89_00035 [Candidatus Altiarchaeales archaeon HGW-Altiarchaeales-2]|nr:MAG: hypothetical protein CVT89_00035 [Candidatus Altiarchaeales archaeon HGW-Altiarchaeales-2]